MGAMALAGQTGSRRQLFQSRHCRKERRLTLAGRVLACLQGMIRKLESGTYRLYSRKKDPKTGKRRNLGTFSTRAAAQKHERAVQYFKHH